MKPDDMVPCCRPGQRITPPINPVRAHRAPGSPTTIWERWDDTEQQWRLTHVFTDERRFQC